MEDIVLLIIRQQRQVREAMFPGRLKQPVNQGIADIFPEDLAYLKHLPEIIFLSLLRSQAVRFIPTLENADKEIIGYQSQLIQTADTARRITIIQKVLEQAKIHLYQEMVCLKQTWEIAGLLASVMITVNLIPQKESAKI